MPIQAVQHVRRMRGGAQSQLMRCSDAALYVVKFRNNPQHVRVLANEHIATCLAERVGLPVAGSAVVEVGEWLVQHSPEMSMQTGGGTFACSAGLNYGSRLVMSPSEGQMLDWVPQSHIERVRNLGAFAGMLAFDKWTCNANGRQAVFCRKPRQMKYAATFVDHGYCFNAGEWNFPDSPLRGVYAWNEVYENVGGWDSFEPWLTRMEELDEATILAAGESVPPEWYEADWEGLQRLLELLVRRRARVREMIEEFRSSSRQPFPHWTSSQIAVAATAGI